MGGVSEDAAVVEAEALVLSATLIMGSVHMVAVVLLEEVIIILMIGAGGLEVGVLDEGLDEAPLEGEIGVQSGKEALKEGQ